MPQGDEVIRVATADNWQSGLIALVCIFVVGIVGWAFMFAVRRIYGSNGYKERATFASEQVAERQVKFIDCMQSSQQHREDLCSRHASAIETVAAAVQQQADNMEQFALALTDSDGISGVGKRLEVTATEMADIALLLFDRPWGELAPDEQQRVRDKVANVRKRHDRKPKE